MLKFRWFRFLSGSFFAAALLLAGCSRSARLGETLTPTPEATGTAAPAPQPENPTRLPARLKFEPFEFEPGRAVLAMLQDRQGFLWLAGEEALYRYDGYQLKPFQPTGQDQDPAALQTARRPTRFLVEDQAGQIWVVVGDDLARFDPRARTWVWYARGAGEANHLGSAAITALVNDPAGHVWVATDGDGVFRLEPESGQMTQYRRRQSDTGSLGSDSVTALAAGRGGALWAGTRTGELDRLDPVSGQFTRYPLPQNRRGGVARAIAALVEDPTGDVWLAVAGGLWGFDPELESFTFFAWPAATTAAVSQPSALALDPAGNFWLGTLEDGLYRFTPRSGEWAHYQNDPNDAYSLSQDQVAGLLVDRTGILWVQLASGGVDRFDPRAGFRAYQPARGNPNSLSGERVTAVLVDSNRDWWVGTAEGGLSRFEARAGRWTHFQHDPNRPNSLSSNAVTALAEDPFGRIWVGTADGGLNRLDPPSGKWTLFTAGPGEAGGLSDARVGALLAGSNGNLWAGAGDGVLNQVEPETGRVRQFPPPDPLQAPGDPGRMALAITALVEAPDGGLWLGSQDGRLLRFEPRSASWQSAVSLPLAGEASLPAPVTSLWFAGGQVWIGTDQDGLYRFDPNSETFTRYARPEGLPGDSVLGLLGDRDGKLWLGTEQGLARFDPAGGAILAFDAADGLPADIFVAGAAYRSAAGELFFGTAAGLLAFYPELVHPNPFVPPVVITDFQLLYESVQPGAGSPWRQTSQGDEIRLGYSQNVFTFEFAALDYSNPGENQYEYKLEGFDPEWVQAGTRRQVSYTSLEPGAYTFRVRGSNNAGVWNQAGAAVAVTILPPFWMTAWFRAAVTGLALAFVTAGVGLRLGAVNRQKLALQRQVDERTRELQGALAELEASREAAERAAVLEERQRLARELHDSVTQLLYGQVLSADIGYKYLKKGDLRGLEETLVRLREVAGQSLKEMRLLLYELRPSSFEDEGLINALDLRLDAVERRSRIESALEVQGEVDLPPQVAWEVYRIAIEALNNSLKHAAATQVSVRLAAVNGSVELEVQDNGQGFEVDGADKGGFGIRSMRQRAAGIGGRLAIESRPGEGTRVRAWVPLPE